MTIWHISDTHGHHNLLNVPDLQTIDVIVHSGDESNNRVVYQNKQEFIDFVEWYKSVNHPYKIFVPGNHSSFVYNNQKEAKRMLNDAGIIFLNKTSIEIKGLVFYGDPTTPKFGNWFFMAKREKTINHWKKIPENCDILITHGPPKHCLDLTNDIYHRTKSVGDSSLFNTIQKLPNIKVCLYGHVHDCENIINHGILYRDGKIYSNASAVTDNKFSKGITHNGNIINL
ncbi:MAG: hypothetical protein E6Q36_08590 [Chryseobacterium sp.]|nr:MAG: hypothetical protein E6Q36_08590 [Chryseobacterium sp.]